MKPALKTLRVSATSILSLAAGAIAAAAIAAAWVPLSREAARRERESLALQLEVVTGIGRLQLGPLLEEGADSIEMERILDGIRESAGLDEVGLLDPEGTVLLSAPPSPDRGSRLQKPLVKSCLRSMRAQPDPEALVSTEGAAEGARTLQAACTRVSSGEEPVALVVVASADYADALSATRLRATLMFLGLGLVVGLVVVAATRWLLSPVREVSAAAGRIAAGTRGVMVRVQGPEEIAQLARAVNTLASSFEAREDDIRARHDVVNQLSSMVAHEVRNPLQSLSLLCALARTETDDATRNSLLEKIESEIHVLEGVVQRFLRSSGPLQISRTTVDLVEVLKRAAAVAEPEARRRSVSLMVQAPGRLQAEADGSLVRRALENLMLNAIEFASQEPPGQVTAAILPRGREVLLIVEDDGPGVPEEERGRIFQAYYSSKAGGTGLGLALVKQVFDAHGGSIRCEPSSLGGARFVAALPLGLPPGGDET